MGHNRLTDRRTRKKRTVYGSANREIRRGYVGHDDFTEALPTNEEPKTRQRKTPEIEEQRRNPSELRNGRWPRIMIARRFNASAPGSQNGWEPFFENLEARNTSKGHCIAIGSLACVYASDGALGKMLEKKYTNAYQDRKKALEIQKAFAAEFRQFIRSEGKTRADAEFEQQTAPSLYAGGFISVEAGVCSPASNEDWDDGGVFDHFEDDQSGLPQANSLWVADSFTVSGIVPSAVEGRYGLDLRGDQRIYEEWSLVRKYLKHEGLDVDIMDKDDNRLLEFQPNLDFYQSKTGFVVLQHTVERPTTIPLHPPAAYSPR